MGLDAFVDLILRTVRVDGESESDVLEFLFLLRLQSPAPYGGHCVLKSAGEVVRGGMRLRGERNGGGDGR